MSQDKDSRVAIVTGAARPWGIGRATAVTLAERGYDIVIADVRKDWGDQGAESIIASTGQRAIYVPCDVSQRGQVAAMAEETVSTFGRIDALVNNAGVSAKMTIEEFTDEDFNRTMGINLLGPILCTQAVIPAMKDANYGRIVNIASTIPYQPIDGPRSIYAASKGGLIGWTKNAAAELAKYGIVVTVVAVGGLSTGFGRDEPPDPEEDARRFDSVYRGALPWGRVLRAEEAAEIIAFAVDTPNHAMLGSTIHASGGRVMPM